MRIGLIGMGLTQAMAVYQSEDVYASFGVNGAVMSSNNVTEHEKNMLTMDVAVRDGDDSFELVDETTDEVLEEGQEGTTDEVIIKDGTEVTDEVTPGDDEEGDGDQEGADEFTPLGEPSDDLKSASAQIDEYAEGFQQMRAQAIKQGLDPSVAARIEAEYESDNQLSEASLKALEDVGFQRGFVKSFIGGQEALAQAYVAQIQAYAGGPEKFQAIMAHLNANSPDAAESLSDAIGRQDLASIKTLINLGMASRTKKFGKAPERSVTKRAPATTPQSQKPVQEGFSSQREMVKAMGDARYQNDPSYRAEVEAKVLRSSW